MIIITTTMSKIKKESVCEKDRKRESDKERKEKEKDRERVWERGGKEREEE